MVKLAPAVKKLKMMPTRATSKEAASRGVHSCADHGPSPDPNHTEPRGEAPPSRAPAGALVACSGGMDPLAASSPLDRSFASVPSIVRTVSANGTTHLVRSRFGSALAELKSIDMTPHEAQKTQARTLGGALVA